ncbi:MAG: hypothetical protein IKB09_03615 [Oscillospiraceae bacterium]|nr:hypothetical protein [Oscillospiraceae bacterium]
MNHMIMTVTGTVAVYLALFLLITLPHRRSKKLIAGTGIIAAAFGFLFYGYCFSAIHSNSVLAIAQTCYAVLLQYLGSTTYSLLSGSAPMQQPGAHIILNILCFLGIFTTAGATISAIGTNFLQKLRLFIRRGKSIFLIYSLNPNTLSFARDLIASKDGFIVFVDEAPDMVSVKAAQKLGCLIRSDENAISGNPDFLRSLGMKKGTRKLSLFGLSMDQFANRQYACHLAEALQKHGIYSQQTSLTIFANEDQIHNTITSTDGTYTFGSILCVSPEQLAARLLMQKSPTWDSVTFDETGQATEDFHALVIGGGKVGQAVIKQITINSQFCGSQFSLTIFDPHFHNISGQLCQESRQIFDQYNIHTEPYDARSSKMFDFLQQNADKLKYIVICSGNDSTNRDIALQLAHYLDNHEISLPIHICSSRGIQRITSTEITRWKVFTLEALCPDRLDRLAMLLHHNYCGDNGKTAEENWAECNYFNRMSSRASVDFIPAFLKMAGLSADSIPGADWCTPQQLENMAISEHKRWCAFHYCMGFRCMTEEEFSDRCEIYKEEKSKDPDSNYRISKDVPLRIHRCLIPWEQLDNLSAAENAITGGDADYKESDRKNVRLVPKLMRAARQDTL